MENQYQRSEQQCILEPDIITTTPSPRTTSTQSCKAAQMATLLAEKGLSIILLLPKEKKPQGGWKQYQEKKLSSDEIRSFFNKISDANIGIVTGKISKIVIVDLDTPEAIEWAEIVLDPTTFIVQTSKGQHWYYKHPGHLVPGAVNVMKDAAPGVDIRGDGNYVVGPGSVHPSGDIYKITSGTFDDLDNLPLFPSELFSRPTTGRTQRFEEHVTISSLSLGDISEGTRNSSLTRLAGFLLGKGAIPSELTREILSACNTVHAGLPEMEVEGIFNSIRRTESAQREWQEPLPVNGELPPVLPMVPELLPDSIRDWVFDVADRMKVAPDFPAVAIMVIAGSIIGTSCHIQPKKEDNWTVVPNLWGAICGYPSDGKTPSLEEVLSNGISRLEKEASGHQDQAMKSYLTTKTIQDETTKIRRSALKQALKEKHKIDEKQKSKEISNSEKKPNGGEPEEANNDEEKRLKLERIIVEMSTTDETQPPKKRRYRTNNASVEKIGEMLSDNPRGILVYRDELVGAFNKWDENGDRPFYLESWSGKSSFQDDKIGRGNTEVEKSCLSILGTIQPDRITKYLTDAIHGSDNDGFVQRFQLMVFPDKVNWEYIDRCPDIGAKNKTFDALHKLAYGDFSSINFEDDHAIFTFSDEAQGAFKEWFTNLHKEKIHSTTDQPVLIEHFGKYRSLLPSLALIFHLLDQAANGFNVEGQDNGPPSYRFNGNIGIVPVSCVTRARGWCEYLESHAKRIYSLAADRTVRAASTLVDKIKEGRLEDGFSRRIVRRKGWKSLTDDAIIEEAILTLVEHNIIRALPPTEPHDQGGRRALPGFEINPKIYE